MRQAHSTLFFLAIISFSFCAPVSAKTTLGNGDLSGFLEGGEEPDYNVAIDALWERAAEEPYNYEIYHMLMAVYDEIGDHENALEAAKAVIDYLPEDSKEKDLHYGNLAWAFISSGAWEQGKEWLDRADAVNKDNFFNRIQAFRYFFTFKKDYRSAALELGRLDKLGGKDKDVYYEAYAQALRDNAAKQEIVALFREAVRRQPRSFKAHRALGTALRDSSAQGYEANIPLAMAEFQKALRLNPKYLPTYISIADMYMIRGARTKDAAHYQEALDWFNKAHALEPENLNLAYAMGVLFTYMQDYDKAIAKLEPLCRGESPHEPSREQLASAYNGKAYGLYQAGERLEEGLVLVERALALQPKNGIILSTKAELLYKMGRFQEAYEYIKESIQLEPEREEIQRDLKMIEAALAGMTLTQQ